MSGCSTDQTGTVVYPVCSCEPVDYATDETGAVIEAVCAAQESAMPATGISLAPIGVALALVVAGVALVRWVRPQHRQGKLRP